MASNSSSMFSTSYFRFKNGKQIQSPNSSVFTSNSTLISPHNFSYNYNSIEAGSQVGDLNRISKFKKDNSMLKSNFKNERKTKVKMMENVHKEFLMEKLKKNGNLEGFFMTEGADDYKRINKKNIEIKNEVLVSFNNNDEILDNENNFLQQESGSNFFQNSPSCTKYSKYSRKEKKQSRDSLDLNKVFTPKKFSSSKKVSGFIMNSPEEISFYDKGKNSSTLTDVNFKYFSALRGGHSKNISAQKIAKDLNALNIRETLPDFLEKVTEIRRGQFIKEIQNERVARIEETYLNRLEEVKDTMKNMKTSQILLNDWDNNFVTYVRHLKFQRDVEKIENEKLLQNRSKLETETKHARNKIVKLQNELEAFIDRRNFLICVKERKKNLPDFFFEKLEQMEEESIRKSGILPSHFNSIFLNTKMSSRKKAASFNNGIIFNSKLQKGHISELERLVSYITSNKVFNSVKEFNDTMEFLEKENLRLLMILNKNNQSIEEQKVENEKLSKNISTTDDKFTNEILNKEKTLSEYKLKSKKLKEELDKLIDKQENDHENRKPIIDVKNNSNIKRFSTMKFETISNFKINTNKQDEKNSSNILYSKLKEIFSLLKSNLYFLNLNDNINFATNSEVDLTNMKTINLLKNVEKGVNFLVEKYKNYKNEENSTKTKTVQNFNQMTNMQKVPLSLIEWNLEKERKSKKTNEQKLKIDGKRQLQKHEVLERANKIVILPKRKANDRFRPKEDKRKNTFAYSDENAKFEDYINYDD
jgi:hypothetical protein